MQSPSLPEDDASATAQIRAALASGDAWFWRMHYRDGSTLEEFDGDGQDHGFAEVAISEVIAVELLPLREGLPSHVMLIDLAAGQRPIFFRRRLHPLIMTGDGAARELARVSATVIGWQQTVRRKNVAHFTAFFEDGSSFACTDRDTLNNALHQAASTHAAVQVAAEEAEAAEAANSAAPSHGPDSIVEAASAPPERAPA